VAFACAARWAIVWPFFRILAPWISSTLRLSRRWRIAWESFCRVSEPGECKAGVNFPAKELASISEGNWGRTSDDWPVVVVFVGAERQTLRWLHQVLRWLHQALIPFSHGSYGRTGEGSSGQADGVAMRFSLLHVFLL